MRIWTVARRELKALFDLPTGYVLLVVFLAMNGFLFFRQAYLTDTASLRPMLDALPWIFLFFVPAVILAEAGLSFLGLGDPSLPTWGQILEDGFRTGAVFLGYWWWVISPGLLIVLTAMTFMLLALAMEPIVNPRLRKG